MDESQFYLHRQPRVHADWWVQPEKTLPTCGNHFHTWAVASGTVECCFGQSSQTANSSKLWGYLGSAEFQIEEDLEPHEKNITSSFYCMCPHKL